MQSTNIRPGLRVQANRNQTNQGSSYSSFAPANTSPLAGIGIFLLVLELIVQQTRFFDIYFVGLRIPMMIFLLLLSCLALYLPTQMENVTRRAPALVAVSLGWLCVTTLFSTWRSNSAARVTDYLYLALVSIAIIALIDTPRRFSQIFPIFGFLYGFAAILGIFHARPNSPRLMLFQGTYADPNLYGLCILTGIPVMWWVTRFSNSYLLRILALFLSLFMFLMILKTGSRGAVASFAIILVFVFFYAAVPQKIIILLIMMIGLVGSSFLLSTFEKKRLLTLFTSTVEQVEAESMTSAERDTLDGTIGSSEGRLSLFKDSVTMTLTHPLFGVGPGNFGDARWSSNLKMGQRTDALTTHNTYTQFSSEAGIPALILFLLQIVEMFRNLRVIRKWKSEDGYRPSENLLGAAQTLRFVLIGLCLGMGFLSLAYSGPFLIIFGLVFALRNTVEKDWRQYLAFKTANNAAIPKTRVSNSRPVFQPAFRMR